jgi:hypothetical protein
VCGYNTGIAAAQLQQLAEAGRVLPINEHPECTFCASGQLEILENLEHLAPSELGSY